VSPEKRQVTGARTIPIRTNTVRCVVRHRRVPAPVQSPPNQGSLFSLFQPSWSSPKLTLPSRPTAVPERTRHISRWSHLESPTARRCELLRRMTSSRTRSTRRGCAVTAGSHLLCGQSRCGLAEPASCLPVVSLIGWYLVLAPICPRRNSVRVRNIFPVRTLLCQKMYPSISWSQNPNRTNEKRSPPSHRSLPKESTLRIPSFTFLPNLVIPVLPTCACDTHEVGVR
jgi:hypothetical protein